MCPPDLGESLGELQVHFSSVESPAASHPQPVTEEREEHMQPLAHSVGLQHTQRRLDMNTSLGTACTSIQASPPPDGAYCSRRLHAFYQGLCIAVVHLEVVEAVPRLSFEDKPSSSTMRSPDQLGSAQQVTAQSLVHLSALIVNGHAQTDEAVAQRGCDLNGTAVTH